MSLSYYSLPKSFSLAFLCVERKHSRLSERDKLENVEVENLDPVG